MGNLAKQKVENPLGGIAGGCTRRRKHKTHRVRADATGHYRVRLAPGRYVVTRTNWGPGSINPTAATVPYGRFKRVDIFIDTGIR